MEDSTESAGDELSALLDELELPDELKEDEPETEDIEDILPDEPEAEDEPEADSLEELNEAMDNVIQDQPEVEAEEPEANPMAELQQISASTAGEQKDSFDKLKTLSKKIIDGEAIDLGVNIKSEIKELLDLILETKKRVDDIGPSLATSNGHIPNVLNTLESVTETTEDATLSLMENADGLNNYYQEFIQEIDDLEDLVYKKDTAAIIKKIVKIEQDLEQADSMGYNILHALEFQDITEQKIQKVIGAVRDIGARLGAILGFIKLKQEQDPTVADDASQEDIDKLLADFGLD